MQTKSDRSVGTKTDTGTGLLWNQYTDSTRGENFINLYTQNKRHGQNVSLKDDTKCITLHASYVQ